MVSYGDLAASEPHRVYAPWGSVPVVLSEPGGIVDSEHKSLDIPQPFISRTVSFADVEVELVPFANGFSIRLGSQYREYYVPVSNPIGEAGTRHMRQGHPELFGDPNHNGYVPSLVGSDGEHLGVRLTTDEPACGVSDTYLISLKDEAVTSCTVLRSGLIALVAAPEGPWHEDPQLPPSGPFFNGSCTRYDGELESLVTSSSSSASGSSP